MFGRKLLQLASIVVIVLSFRSLAFDCSFQGRDLFANDLQSTVNVSCTWNAHTVDESQGWIFGLKIFHSSPTCKIKPERILTITSSTMEKKCPSFHHNFKEWCVNYLTNATLTVDTIDAVSKVTASVEFPVQSLFEYNISYNGTANSPILLYWLPHFTGQHDNKTAEECIIHVCTFGENSPTITSPLPDTTQPKPGGNSPATMSPLPFTTQPEPGGNSPAITSPLPDTTKPIPVPVIIAIPVVFVLVGIGFVLFFCYRRRCLCRGNDLEGHQMNEHAAGLETNGNQLETLV